VSAALVFLIQQALTPVPQEVPETVLSSPRDVHVRLLDLVEIDGVRSNQLVGTGLVAGLKGTGDSSQAAKIAIANFLKRQSLNVSPTEVESGNIALVSLTATLPAFAKAGTRVDVSVQSIGAADSLFGGVLLQSPLYGANGQVYVVAQGSVSVGGIFAAGDAASVTQNHPVVGIITDGGAVEREVPMQMVSREGVMHLHLRSPNYMTAHRVSVRLNEIYPGSARALDSATIRVRVPEDARANPVAFLAGLGEQTVVPVQEAIVVVNERTGTIVAGHRVRITTAAISHGNLTISIAESPEVAQPAPFSDGETTTVPRTQIDANNEHRELMVIDGGTSVNDLANALNKLGVSSRDLVSIFQALKRGGYLQARLEVM
jgi:flagellar P-ring protein precursor FlgI